MKKLYLLGHPVSHSLSPIMQNAAIQHFGLDWHYETKDVHPQDLIKTLEELEADPDVIGCNVTVPHKVSVFDWLWAPGNALIRNDALNARAVNTLYRNNGPFAADSTDFQGAFQALWIEGFPGLKDMTGVLSEYDIAILGTGGTAQTLSTLLAAHKSSPPRSITIFGRNLSKASSLAEALHPIVMEIQASPDRQAVSIKASNLSEFPDWSKAHPSAIVIQTTTVGMETGENPGQSPVPSGSVGKGQIAFDLVYKPHDTPFLVDAAKHGATLVHGINMLIGQGALAFHYWAKSSANLDVDPFEVAKVMRSALGV